MLVLSSIKFNFPVIRIDIMPLYLMIDSANSWKAVLKSLTCKDPVFMPLKTTPCLIIIKYVIFFSKVGELTKQFKTSMSLCDVSGHHQEVVSKTTN